MKVFCLSASNSRKVNEESVSYKVCQLTKNLLLENSKEPSIQIHVRSLQDSNLIPCQLCGACSSGQICPFDDDFNHLYEEIISSDVIFMVVPHYSPIPSKLIILFEKLNEIAYSAWLMKSNPLPRFHEITVGIIGHGGMTETPETLKYYQDSLIKPISNTLTSLGFKVLKIQNDQGVTFGLKDDSCLEQTDTALFPNILFHETFIHDRIKQLVISYLNSLS